MASSRNCGTGARKGKRGLDAFPWTVVISGGVIVIATIGFLAYLAVSSDAVKARIDLEADKFQLEYWQKPIPLQGEAPSGYAEIARGLQPENCGLCHYRQYQDWTDSMHAKAMGAGVMGQFPPMGFSDRSSCLECHAPMSEQWDKLANAGGSWEPNAGFDPALQGKGLVCGACHLRGHRRFGPPAAPEKAAEGMAATEKGAASSLIHGDPVRTGHFQASEFCKGCHQHSTSTVMVNGKTIENTYQEWLQSPYAEKGITCQKCHMPQGRHLWRGIHDPEMTRSGVTISSSVDPAVPVMGERVSARLVLANTGTGHAFPTYTTPAVFLKAAFLDGKGQVLGGEYYAEKILQRRLNMNTTPWSEHFDTRVAPGKEAVLEFTAVVPAGARTLYLWVWVEPDNFYSGFFRSYLRNGQEFPGGAKLAEALNKSLENRYLLYSEKIAVNRSN